MRTNDPMQHEDGVKNHYLMFTVNMVPSLIMMYFVMFSMIDGWGDFRMAANASHGRLGGAMNR
jgi:hypothetical protein